jgi:hypothetical protein
MIHAAPKPPVRAKHPAFCAWLKQQPCWLAGTLECEGIVEVSHIESRRYGDAGNAIPLCGFGHHREGRHAFHRLGRQGFEAYWQVDVAELAGRYWRRFQKHPGDVA